MAGPPGSTHQVAKFPVQLYPNTYRFQVLTDCRDARCRMQGRDSRRHSAQCATVLYNVHSGWSHQRFTYTVAPPPAPSFAYSTSYRQLSLCHPSTHCAPAKPPHAAAATPTAPRSGAPTPPPPKSQLQKRCSFLAAATTTLHAATALPSGWVPYSSTRHLHPTCPPIVPVPIELPVQVPPCMHA